MCDGDPEDFLVVYGLYLQDTFSRGEQDVRERVTLTVFRNEEKKLEVTLGQMSQ